VDGRSDRIGLRLTGRDPVPSAADGAIPSTGMVTGSIQVPPDGAPIVLMPDHATVGGYPVVGCVIAADLPALGQLRPGDPVRFTGVELDEALRIAVRHRETLAARVSGWFPTRAGT
jgi:allophanate hydrolase subunit 2